MRKLLTTCLLVLMSIPILAQTNMTSKIKNPSFENNGFDGWVQTGMATQNNTSFTKKSGTTYVEKWTARGGAVGNASVMQTVTGLEAGRYSLTAAAQNIQEDSPTQAQTGAYIVGNDARTTVTVRNDYTVEFTVIDGTATIGFVAENASGNWLAVDNFRLSLIGDGKAEITKALEEAINAAKTVYGDGSGQEASALNTAIKNAEQTLANSSASTQQLADQIPALEEAVYAYKLANASSENPLDMTSRIQNPSFENSFEGWTNAEMQIQANTAFSLKNGNNYVEKWTQSGAVGNGSVMQTINGIPTGRYRLTAAAQNIQESSPSTHRAGAYICGEEERTAVGARKSYTVEFISITGDATIGFVADNAQGNWIAVDNFRLYYIGKDATTLKDELKRRIDAAQALTAKKMRAEEKTALTTAIANATSIWQEAGDPDYTKVAKALRAAVENAQKSVDAYEALSQALTQARAELAKGGDNGKDDLNNAINEAQATYDADTSDNNTLETAVKTLSNAVFSYYLANGSGTVPTVKTDPRYARGCIEAFGRMTVTGVPASQIKEQGFCYATHPDPTVLDERSTDYLENNGRIYRMSMQPATIYYMRAYAITNDYAVGYGDVIKLSTLPMGDVTFEYYNHDGGDFHMNKNMNALTEACWYWSNYTYIRGFHVVANYSPGTPTADCGYGGGMRIGSNTGQRTGTMMHEMNHGIGGGTLGIWGGWENSWLRVSMNGDWAGERANAVVRFWENREDIVITGAYDNGHWGVRTFDGVYSQDNMWCNKYPFNGSHLEAGNWAGPKNWNETQIAYIGNALIQQGMCEDGLVPVNYYGGGFCLPGYVFPHEDNQKYYIKSEDEAHGLYTAYLKEGQNGAIRWEEIDDAQVAHNDSAAWYVSFNPAVQYYQLRNAATGHYISYTSMGANGFKALEKANVSNNENFHLIRGRQAIEVGGKNDKFTTHSYWLIHPQQSNTPPCLTAAANHAVSANSVNLFDSGVAMRWVFMEADEVDDFVDGMKKSYTQQVNDIVSQIRKLQRVPHTEDVDGADDDLATDLEEITAAAQDLNTVIEAKTLAEKAMTSATDFLSKVTPTNSRTPFDLTFMIENAAIDDNTGWSIEPTFANSCCEFFEKAFDFNQTLNGLPRGTFKLSVQAFQRPGAYAAAYNAYANGTNNVNAVLYAASKTVKIKHIGEEARVGRLNATDVSVGTPARYIPNSMAGAAAYFNNKLYDNELMFITARNNSSVKVGLRGTVATTGYWTCFDNFRLYYYGSLTPDQVTAIEGVETEQTSTTVNDNNVYNLQGVIVRKNATSLDGLQPGIYIFNGNKILIK